MDAHCKFCEALALQKWCDKTRPIKVKTKYSVAIVSHLKGSRITSYRYRGHGYALNYCPECGKLLHRRVGRWKG